jgi:hypothetical protein
LSNLYTNITNNLTDKQNKRNNGEILSLNLNQEKDMDKRMSPECTRKLQDEINTLTKRNCELESQLRSLEAGHSKDIFIDTLDGAESGKCTIHVENKYFK